MLLYRRFIYLILVMVAALAVEVRYVSGQGYWVLWSALSLALVINGSHFSKRCLSILALGILLAIFSLLTAVLSIYPSLLIAFLVVGTFISMLFTQHKPEYSYPIFIITFLTILSAVLPATIMTGINRAYDIMFGTLIASVFQLVFLPGFYGSEISTTIQQMLVSLQSLTEDIFACFLQPTYTENTYLYERRIHTQKKRFIGLYNYALNIDAKYNKSQATLKSLEKIVGLLQSCALLRMRIADPTIFTVCSQELTEIDNEIRLNLREMEKVYRHKNLYMNTQGLEERIERLENNYQTVLQVSAHEPVVFMIFISNLKALKDEIEKFEMLQLTKPLE